MAIIDRSNWPTLDSLVKVQQRNRETHSPVISLYRWWARRPHAVVCAILDGASAEFGSDLVVVPDPFSGGATGAVTIRPLVTRANAMQGRRCPAQAAKRTQSCQPS